MMQKINMVVDNMSDLIEETHLDYKEEQKLKYFKKSLPFVIGGTIIVIVIMIISNWLNNKKIKHNQEIGDLFIQTIQTNGGDKKLLNDSLSTLMKESDNGVADLAHIEKIKIMMDSSNARSALPEIEALINNANKPVTKSYAMILWMNIMIDQETLSDANKTQMLKYIDHFKNSDTPFYGSAMIIKGLFEIKNQQIDQAKVTLQQIITNINVTSTVQDQARSILSNLDI